MPDAPAESMPAHETTQSVDYAMQTTSTSPPIRIWPAVIISIIALTVFIASHLVGEPTMTRLITVFVSPLVGALLVLIWWLGFSRARGRDKWLGVLGMALLAGALALLAEPVGRIFIALWGISITAMIMVFYWALTSNVAPAMRRRGLMITALCASVPWLCVKTTGQNGEGLLTFDLRWSNEAAESLASWRDLGVKPNETALVLPARVSKEDWPGFRGPNRDGVYRGDASLTANDIKDMTVRWRHAVGAGWSSFCVVGPAIYTQEQRGNEECVVCYELDTGAERWVYALRDRFDDVSGGPGPRATPTYLDKRLYTYGPQGHLACLDAATGTVIWAVEAATDGVPMWGAACSPLLVNDLVVVGLYGKGGRLAAYQQADGKLAWRAEGGADGYSSPHLVSLDGEQQIAILDGTGFSGHAIDDGAQLWFYEWQTDQPKVVQPWLLSESDVLISMGYGQGMRRLRIERMGEDWTVNEVWTSNRLKTKFNDFVCKDDYAYGLDEGILTCINLKDGTRAWKGGRYGYGQVLLVDNKLLVLSENGEVILANATPDAHNELIRRKVFDSKTWNHPVIAQGKLLVRNDREAVCFDLP